MSTCNELPRKLNKSERKPPVTIHVGHAPHKIRTCDVRGSPSSKEHSWAKVGVEHVLPLVDSFHLYDRIGRAVSHNEMLEVDRIPAIVELCVQAATAVRGMKAWEKMRGGASKLMGKYAVQTCGYYPEVQVGPKGHRVRNCQAFKHQIRDGQLYVYHIRDDQHRKPLVNELKRYYGMLPAVVELFAQAGAPVDKNYASMMREDVVIPEMDEEKLEEEESVKGTSKIGNSKVVPVLELYQIFRTEPILLFFSSTQSPLTFLFFSSARSPVTRLRCAGHHGQTVSHRATIAPCTIVAAPPSRNHHRSPSLMQPPSLPLNLGNLVVAGFFSVPLPNPCSAGASEYSSRLHRTVGSWVP
ncbi:APO protein 3, mitochondrial [Glycine max]|nr:APO protein 3, mitochondrial [Glycine max]